MYRFVKILMKTEHMKKLILFCGLTLAAFSATGQITTPDASPSATLTQKVGLTDVSVAYSRPSMRGRTIFGDLVPYGKIWRTGANMRTKVSFGNDVTIGGKELKAGTYALLTTPGPNSWEVYFYTEYDAGGAPKVLDPSKVALQTTVDALKIPEKIETFTITIDDLTSNGALLGIMWADVYVGIPFAVPTDAAVSANIDRVMNGPTAGDYYAAAVYYFSEGKDVAKAKEWMDKAMQMTPKPAFWQLRQQSLILAKVGDKKGAIQAAQKSLAAAKEAGNDDYVKMNNDSLKEWGGL